MGGAVEYPERKRASARRAVPGGIVKSAGRVLHILEMFDGLRRPASVTEIAKRLGLPQSSTSALLRSMLELGYLAYDGTLRMFRPTTSVALLGAWINPPMAGDGALLGMARDLASATDLGVVIASRNQINVQYMHVETPAGRRSAAVKGMLHPLTASAHGLTLMADLADADIRRIALRTDYERGTHTCIATLLSDVEQVRRSQFALMPELGAQDQHVLAITLPRSLASEQLAIGVTGPASEISRQTSQLLASLHGAVDNCVSRFQAYHRPRLG